MSSHQDTARDDAPKPARWARALNSVASLNTQRDPLLVRKSLLENIDRLTSIALERTRLRIVGETSEEHPDPDVRTALQAQIAAARLLGVDDAREVFVGLDVRHLDALVAQARRALAARQQPIDTDASPSPERAPEADRSDQTPEPERAVKTNRHRSGSKVGH